MKCIWVFLIILILINVAGANNLLEYKNINRNFSKIFKPSKYILTKRRTTGLLPSLLNRENQLMVNLKPPIKTYTQVIKPELYKKSLIRKLSIQYKNYKGNDKLKAEVTTRRPLMQTMKFTVRPHDVYAESIREKYNSNSNRRMINYKPIMLKSERNILKTNSKTIRDELRIFDIKNVEKSLIDNDYNLLEKQNNKNSYVAPRTLKSKTIILFSKSNNTKYVKENSEQRVFKRLQINNVIFEGYVPSIVINNGINDFIIEDKENETVPSNLFVHTNYKDQMHEMKENKENFINQDESIPVKEANEITIVKPDVGDDDERTTDSDIEYSISRPKRSVNVIEEESIATTFSGIKITDQDYPLNHDFTFKNIHT